MRLSLHTLSIGAMLVLVAGDIALAYAGFQDAHSLEEVQRKYGFGDFQYVHIQCPSRSVCEFVYQVAGVDLVKLEFGQTEARLSEVSEKQLQRTEDLHALAEFWTEHSTVVKLAEGGGLLHMLKEAIQKSKPVAEAEETLKGDSGGVHWGRLAVIGSLAGVAYGTGYFVAEHWFPNGPASATVVEYMKQTFPTPEFQRRAFRTIVFVWSTASEHWTSTNIASPSCSAMAPRDYPDDFATDEAFSRDVMLDPCNRVEFDNMIKVLKKRLEIISKGRRLRKIDVEVAAGLQRYSESQHAAPE